MGREPTSRSCHTCRKRRVKCDQTRPVCRRCHESHLECQGYKKILRVQNYGVIGTAGSDSSHIGLINRTTSYPAISTLLKGASHAQRGPSSTLTTHHGQINPPGEQSSSPRPPSSSTCQPQEISPPPEPGLSPFFNNIVFTYFFNSYGWINVHSILLQDTPMRQHLAEDTDNLGLDSLRALTYGLFGRDHHIEALRRLAGRLYDASLRQLRLKLSSATKQELARLIKPIAIMGAYAVSLITAQCPCFLKLSNSKPLPGSRRADR